jgi:hypothetical protein
MGKTTWLASSSRTPPALLWLYCCFGDNLALGFTPFTQTLNTRLLSFVYAIASVLILLGLGVSIWQILPGQHGAFNYCPTPRLGPLPLKPSSKTAWLGGDAYLAAFSHFRPVIFNQETF